MPLDESSTFIRSVRSGNFVPGVGLDSELGNMVSETKSCGMTGAARLLFRSGVLGPAARRTAAGAVAPMISYAAADP